MRRIRLKLIFAFLGITLLPGLLLFYLVRGLFDQSLEFGFNKEVENALEGAGQISRVLYAKYKDETINFAISSAESDWIKQLIATRNDRSTNLIKKLNKLGKGKIDLYDNNANLITSSSNSDDYAYAKINENMRVQLSQKTEPGFLAEVANPHHISTFAPVLLKGKPQGFIVVTQILDEQFSRSAQEVVAGNQMFKTLDFFRDDQKRALLKSFIVVYAIIATGSIAFGLYFSRSIVTQINELQQQLILREKMASLGNLVAGVAHEVNTPIGAVNSAADVSKRCIGKINNAIAQANAVDEIRRNSKFMQALKLLLDCNQVIVTASVRIASIIKSLKNFSRLDEAENQEADIHEGIDSTLTLVHHEIKNKVEVVKEYGNIPQINCYPNQLNQVFMNLFVNAAQAIGDKGVMTIKTFARNKNVYIKISDSGKGIPRENIKKIFDPGFTTKGVGVGTGLGLAICYNIIQKHDGTISVESEVEKGTIFTISLPIN